ncbi:beige/beach-related [Anaeramoeba flamelloides]|uniref:Beige/beach-related n=1 Tax=Anaeramoeba flamelloides TaxID=1746091 RepID=A0ABQ8Y9M2_9EUKA|nr:beige/beach-related [Anaeramoeba flamelloides]
MRKKGYSPDLLFHSIKKSYELSSKVSTFSVAELCPEFFYLPEFLININKHNYGKLTKTETVVDDVKLPPWSNNDADEFIRMHRQALESDYVSEHLNEWIDLIFGYKQRGEEAIKAKNVFHPCTYQNDKENDQTMDPFERANLLSLINDVGQTPTQLFTEPHAKRKISKQLKNNYKIFLNSQVLLQPKLEQTICKLNKSIGAIRIRNERIETTKKFTSFLPNEDDLVLCWKNADNSIRINSLERRKAIKIYENKYFEQINSFYTDHNNLPYFVTVSYDYLIYLWKFNDNSKITGITLLYKFVGLPTPVTSLTISENDNLLIAGYQDGTMVFWELFSSKFLFKIKYSSAPIISIKINSIDSLIAIAGKNEIFILNLLGRLLTKQKFDQLNFTNIEWCKYFEWHNGIDLIATTQEGNLEFIELAHNQNLEEKKPIRQLLIRYSLKVSKYSIQKLIISNEKQYIIVSDKNADLFTIKRNGF